MHAQPLFDQLDGLRAAVDALHKDLARSPGPALSPGPRLPRGRGGGDTGNSGTAGGEPPPPFPPQPLPSSLSVDPAGDRSRISPLREWASALENPLAPQLLKLADWFDGGKSRSPPGPSPLAAKPLPNASAAASATLETPAISDWSWAAASPSRGGLRETSRRRGNSGYGGSGDTGEANRKTMRSDLVWMDRSNRPASPALSLTPSATSALGVTAEAATRREQLLASQLHRPGAGSQRGVRANDQHLGSRSRASGSETMSQRSMDPIDATEARRRRRIDGGNRTPLQDEGSERSLTASVGGLGGVGWGGGRERGRESPPLRHDYDRSGGTPSGERTGGRRDKDRGSSSGDGGGGGGGGGGDESAGTLRVRRAGTLPNILRPDLSSAQLPGAAASLNSRRRWKTLHVSTSIR